MAVSPLCKIFPREVLDSLAHTLHYESFLTQTSNNALCYFLQHMRGPDLLKRCLAFFFHFQGLAFLPSFAAWLQDISDEGDGNSLTSLAMELKKIMKGMWLFINHI